MTSSSSLFAKMWALRSGVALAHDIGCRNVMFVIDSHVLFNMVKSGYTSFIRLLLLLKEILALLDQKDWTFGLVHYVTPPRKQVDVLICYISKGIDALLRLIKTCLCLVR